MQQHQHEIERGFNEISNKNDPEAVITYLNNFILGAHKQPQCKIKVANKKLQNENIFKECNIVFKQYSKIRKDQNASNAEVPLHLANRCTDLRNKITTDVLKEEHNRWLNILDEHKTDLWKRIDWDGKLNTPPIKDYPSVDTFASHFEDLYKNKDASEAESIMNLV